jgi:hypothetical protein
MVTGTVVPLTATIAATGTTSGTTVGTTPTGTPTGTPVGTPAGTAQGDVHMVTFDGRHYNFQAAGEFVLARSMLPGDTFQVQIETAAQPSIDAISITTEAAARIGSDTVSFGINNAVWLDGTPDTGLNSANPVQDLAGGRLVEVSPASIELTWNTGESLTLTDAGGYLNSAVSLPAEDSAGSVQGLLGSDSGQASDLQLPDGTVLSGPPSESELLGEFANAWSVTSSNSLLNNEPMQFISADGGQVEMQATAPGQVLSAGAGVNVLSDVGGFGATFLGSLADLASETITGFSARDVIGVTDLNSATGSVTYDGSGTAGVLRVTDGTQAGDIQLSGQISAGFHLTTDGHGGSLIAMA